MYHVVLTDPNRTRRSDVMRRLFERGIETRETFIPYNLQDVFIKRGWVRPDACPVANAVAYTGFYLPSGADLDEGQLDYVANTLLGILNERSP